MDARSKEIDCMTLDKLISEQAKKNPDKIAIRHNGQSITYYNLDLRSNQVAAYFISKKIGRNDVVAVAMNRSINLVICLLGIMKAGAAYLPIDPELPLDRVDFILKDASAKVLCTTYEHAELYQNHKDKFIFDEIWNKRNHFATQEVNVDRSGSDLAYILFTSGSTGVPKGVAVEHHNLLNLLLSVQKEPGMTSKDVILGITTISFDIAELEIFLPLLCGAELYIVDSAVAKDGRSLLEIIKNEGITIVQATPFTWRMILQSNWDCKLPIKAFCGGEAMTKELAKSLLSVCSEVWNMYGPTETTVYSIIKKVSLNDEVITIGKPIDNTEVYILNEQKQLVADGEEGEIYIGGDGVARGYVNRADLTAERFVPDTFSGRPNAKIYKTGDVGKLLPNGEILCLGRIDHQIKIRGYRVETEEIEYQLKQLKGVKEALVVLHEDHLGNKQLVAYLVVKTLTGRQLPERTQEWKRKLASKVPSYMVPSSFIIIPKVPLMPNGKVDRKMLPSPAPKKLSSKNKSAESPTEIILSQLFIKHTGFERIGVNENFIDLGLDSLIALKIIVDIEEHFDKRLPLSVLAMHPTIESLGKFINSVSASPYNSLIPLKKDGSKVPLYLIHGIGVNLFNFTGMVSHLDEDQPVYGLRAAGLDGNHKPLESIESIAAYYNQEIINNDPVGPYAIAGYSFGGIIAYEMAKQLKEAGRDVEMLAIIDTNIDANVQKASLLSKLGRKASRQVDKLKFRVKSFYNDPVSNVSYLKEIYKQDFKELLITLGILDRYKASELPEYMQKVVDKLRAAMNNYTIEPYNVKVDLFKADQRIYYVDDPAYLGWQEYALDGVTIYDVPGDHKVMFDAPNDKVLAGLFQQRLDNIVENKEASEVKKQRAFPRHSIAPILYTLALNVWLKGTIYNLIAHFWDAITS